MSFLRSCGSWAVQRATVNKLPMNLRGERRLSLPTTDATELRVFRRVCIACGRNHNSMSVLPKRYFSSSQSHMISTRKPYLIVVKEKESPKEDGAMAQLKQVLDVRLEQLLEESLKHGEPGRFYRYPKPLRTVNRPSRQKGHQPHSKRKPGFLEPKNQTDNKSSSHASTQPKRKFKAKELSLKSVQSSNVAQMQKEDVASLPEGGMPKERIAPVKDRTLSSSEVGGTERTKSRLKSYRTRGETEHSRMILKSQKVDQSEKVDTDIKDDKLVIARTDPKTPEKPDKKHMYHIMRDKSIYLEPLIEVCMFKNMTKRALSEFNSLKSKMPIDVGIYNMMLKGLAQKGALGNIRTLFDSMAASGINPDAQSYAAVLQCIGRMKFRHLQTITKCLSDMALHDITIDDLFLKTTFSNDDRSVMLEVIQEVNPDYIPPRPLSRPHATCGLVQDLYQDEAELSDGQNDESAISHGSLGCSGLLTKEEFQDKFKEQLDLEIKEAAVIKSIEEDGNPDKNTLQKREILQQHKKVWKMSLVQAIKEEREAFKRKGRGISGPDQRSYAGMLYPFLNILKPEEFADLMLQAVADTLACSTEGLGSYSLSHELGNRVHRKLIIRSKLQKGFAEKLEQMYDAFADYHLSEEMMQRYKPREYWQQLEDELLDGPSLNHETKPWKTLTNASLGIVLVKMIARELRLDTAIMNPQAERKLIPAFYNVYIFKGTKNVNYIKPHPTLVDLIEGAKEPDMTFDTTVLPMLVPPLPWNSCKYGGYLLTETRIARCPEGSQQDQELSDPSRLKDWYPVMDSLNQLSAVPWKVNKPILDVIISVFKNNGSKELNIPQPASVLPQPPSITSETSKAHAAHVYRERSLYQKLRGEMHSLRMTDLYKLSIANKYRDEIFWFPYNLDFRGRVYPCPPHFNHLGNDVTRSILVFAKGRPLGDKGLDWLKIHLINLTGFLKKSSNQDRLKYAEEKMPLILDSADNPLEGQKWWQGADKQWQSLACCMEIANAMRSDNPAEFISYFPIHQDGSCNGLQHYAALGRDKIGAEQVNLHPFDVPQDVYMGVADLVEQQRAQDAEDGVEIAQLLEGKVERKVVKQTVMTIVYGVTVYGAKLQILKQLREKEGLDRFQKSLASKYLANAVFNSLLKMFTKTREIQSWLTDSAYYIAKAGHCVDWVTPLGFPVAQPYFKQRYGKYDDVGRSNVQIDTLKQKNGFAPNFIHSLDSTHMMLTSLYCQQAGITYVSVHDCFWTHASTVDEMNQICREQFVKLHGQPVLQNLSSFLDNKYGDITISKSVKKKPQNAEIQTIGDIVKQVPKPGEFDLTNVLQSTYFFS
ncbi:DNA-directed RNA polymerase, mitochondrial-like [Amphiura filiformis]|uniref:DNA-directed RNA polymerase, mitochondrial-like n=1 Tax=Amphiura filiformis TaxID=82378 RepID=UPI003B20E384